MVSPCPRRRLVGTGATPAPPLPRWSAFCQGKPACPRGPRERRGGQRSPGSPAKPGAGPGAPGGQRRVSAASSLPGGSLQEGGETVWGGTRCFSLSRAVPCVLQLHPRSCRCFGSGFRVEPGAGQGLEGAADRQEGTAAPPGVSGLGAMGCKPRSPLGRRRPVRAAAGNLRRGLR